MNPRMDTALVVLSAALYGGLLFHLCEGQCSTEISPVLDEKVARSDVVVQGQVWRQVRTNPQDTYYTVELSVLCVYKGGPVASIINITRAGQVPGSCVQSTLPVGSGNLVYLRRSGDYFSPTFKEDPAESKYLDELAYVCGLRVQFPSGEPSAAVRARCHPEKFGKDYYNDCSDTTQANATPKVWPTWTVFYAISSAGIWLYYCLSRDF